MKTTKIARSITVCNECKADIMALLDQIGQEVNVKEESSWGHAGDLVSVRKSLIEALQSISRLDQDEIESTLSEIRS